MIWLLAYLVGYTVTIYPVTRWSCRDFGNKQPEMEDYATGTAGALLWPLLWFFFGLANISRLIYRGWERVTR